MAANPHSHPNAPPPPPPFPGLETFMQFFDNNRAPGAGVDRSASQGNNPWEEFAAQWGEGGRRHGRGGRRSWGGPWGGGQWGGPWEEHRRGGRRGRRHGERVEEDEAVVTDGEQEKVGEDAPMMSDHEHDTEKAASPETMRGDDEHPDPPEGVPEFPHPHHHHGPGFRGRRGGRCGRGGPGMRGRHGFGPFGPHHGPHHGPGPHPFFGPHPPPPHHGPGAPPPPYSHGAHGFPFGPMMQAFANHPFAHQVREYLERAQREGGAARDATANTNNEEGDETFTPPVDIFRAANGWVLHVAVPGAKKDDVGVNWDPDRSLLSISGVIHRPGNEDFLQGLVSGERTVGYFQRDVTLPPAGAENIRDKDEIDADGIRAKMEDGVLIVDIPMVEREWTEVRKVDIQ